MPKNIVFKGILARLARLERATPRLGGECSIR